MFNNIYSLTCYTNLTNVTKKQKDKTLLIRKYSFKDNEPVFSLVQSEGANVRNSFIH